MLHHVLAVLGLASCVVLWWWLQRASGRQAGGCGACGCGGAGGGECRKDAGAVQDSPSAAEGGERLSGPPQ